MCTDKLISITIIHTLLRRLSCPVNLITSRDIELHFALKLTMIPEVVRTTYISFTSQSDVNVALFPKCIHDLVGDGIFSTQQSLCYRRNVARLLLLCCYLFGKSLHELHSLVSPIRNFAYKSQYTTYAIANYFHFLRILLVRSKFHFRSCIPRTATSWN